MSSQTVADTWICVVAYNCARVLVHYMNNKMGSPSRHSDKEFRPRVTRALWANILALQRMISLIALAKPLVSALVPFKR